MMGERFLTEGKRMGSRLNTEYTSSLEGLRKAMILDEILEARVIRCDQEKNLIVELGDIHGVIPRSESVVGADRKSTRLNSSH